MCFQQDLPERQRAREERPFAALLGQAGLPPDTRQVWAVGRSVLDAILQQAAGYDLVLLGAPVEPRRQRGSAWAGSRRRSSNGAEATVVVVKTAGRRTGDPRHVGRRKAQEQRPAPEALSLVVDKWFAENTFNSEEFADLQQSASK